MLDTGREAAGKGVSKNDGLGQILSSFPTASMDLHQQSHKMLQDGRLILGKGDLNSLSILTLPNPSIACTF